MNDDAFAALFDVLGDVEEALHDAHPDLPLDEHGSSDDKPAVLADLMLLFIDNLRSATHRYRREVHLARYFPAASSD
jgi:hypothetical protein